jgi:hypothetical protein
VKLNEEPDGCLWSSCSYASGILLPKNPSILSVSSGLNWRGYLIHKDLQGLSRVFQKGRSLLPAVRSSGMECDHGIAG